MRMIGTGVDPRYPQGLLFDIDDSATATISDFIDRGLAEEYVGHNLAHILPLTTDAASGDVLGLDSSLDPAWQTPSGDYTAPVNWVSIQFGPSATLTHASKSYTYAQGDYTILYQAGSDFSLATYNGGFTGAGAVVTAAGGRFQTFLVGAPAPNATLDGGSTAPRDRLTFEVLLAVANVA